MRDCFVDSRPGDAVPIYIVRSGDVDFVRSILPDNLQRAASSRDFKAKAGELLILRGESGLPIGVLFGAGAMADDAINALQTGQLARRLPKAIYMVAVKPDDWEWPLLAIGWGLGAYKFNRYLKTGEEVSPQLVLTDMHEPQESRAIISAINNGRDLINTPAGDMGPQALHAEVLALASRHGAQASAVIGDDLLTENYPMIHAVGRAAHEAPRLVELTWGDETHPKLTLVGKGITLIRAG